MRNTLRAASLSLCAFLIHAEDQSGPLATVQKFFAAMSSRDAASIHSLFAPDAVTTAILPDASLSTARSEHFEQKLAASTEPWLERIWDAKVMEHRSIASVWAPYDFHRAGKFSHCGIDNFTLVKLNGEWRITGVTYTMEKEGCPVSPLGPPAH